MGLDMWLPSIFDYNDGDATQRLFDNSPEVQAAQAAAKQNPLALTDALYNTLRATGGYYREPRNELGLFPLLGLSWGAMLASLEDSTVLPPAHARFLLAEIEQHPITPDVIDRAIKTGAMDNNIDFTDIDFTLGARKSQKNPEWVFRYLTGRRDGLIALLRKAIERDEPLKVSG